MKLLKLVAVAMLVWGNFAFADFEDSGGPDIDELQQISSWMALLNSRYRDLNLTVSDKADLTDPGTRKEIRENLQTLHLQLEGVPVHVHPLKQIVCGKAICE